MHRNDGRTVMQGLRCLTVDDGSSPSAAALSYETEMLDSIDRLVR
jgi:hypothetical protein